ncbi:MAG: PilN domain-containing protein, partial [Deltaproteobacteria bacterium]|nr:PilN domain-containing protein [Deltaproteobacteria bacterium]
YNIGLFLNYKGKVLEYEERIAQLDQGEVTRKRIREPGGTTVSKEEVASIKAGVEFVNRLITLDIFPWDRLLDELETRTPSQVSILGLVSLKDENRIKIEAKAVSMSHITQFLKALDESAITRDNILLNVSVGKDNSEGGRRDAGDLSIRFEINSTVAFDQFSSARGEVSVAPGP